MLDADVIVEVLEVAKALDGAERVRRDCRRAVRRHVELVRMRDGGGLEQAGDAAAARDVGLEAVDRRCHPLEVRQHVAVLAGGDLDARRRVVAQKREAFEVVGRDRLLEPLHGELARVHVRPFERLLAG